jgi:hypothetical protein
MEHMFKLVLQCLLLPKKIYSVPKDNSTTYFTLLLNKVQYLGVSVAIFPEIFNFVASIPSEILI